MSLNLASPHEQSKRAVISTVTVMMTDIYRLTVSFIILSLSAVQTAAYPLREGCHRSLIPREYNGLIIAYCPKQKTYIVNFCRNNDMFSVFRYVTD